MVLHGEAARRMDELEGEAGESDDVVGREDAFASQKAAVGEEPRERLGGDGAFTELVIRGSEQVERRARARGVHDVHLVGVAHDVAECARSIVEPGRQSEIAMQFYCRSDKGVLRRIRCEAAHEDGDVRTRRAVCGACGCGSLPAFGFEEDSSAQRCMARRFRI